METISEKSMITMIADVYTYENWKILDCVEAANEYSMN